jgi:hypothetical protein
MKGRKFGINAFVQGELAFMLLGALFTYILVVLFCRWCRALLPHLAESAILSILSRLCRGCPCLRGPRFYFLSSDLFLAFV